jgi:hypothetical protein
VVVTTDFYLFIYYFDFFLVNEESLYHLNVFFVIIT